MNNYDDIINLSHHVSKVHKQMDIMSRSAQFAPYNALNGYSDMIFESNRLTNDKKELSDYDKSIINNKLQIINSSIKSKPYVSIKYFIKDKYKSGGKYEEYSGYVRIIDSINNYIVFTDNKKIVITDIFDINIYNIHSI